MPASLLTTYRAMARNNAWANHRLLAACAGLSQDEFEAPRTGFFPSLKATLNHILVVDWFYVDGLEGGWLGPKAWADREPCATVADLQREQSAVDRRLIAVCEALTEDSLSGYVRINRDTRVQTERRDRLLLHVFQHQIHHRGQAHAMLVGHEGEAAAARRILFHRRGAIAGHRVRGARMDENPRSGPATRSPFPTAVGRPAQLTAEAPAVAQCLGASSFPPARLPPRVDRIAQTCSAL